MKATQGVIDGVISKLKKSINTSSFSRLQLAHDLYWARNVINWRLTDYGGWQNFCAQTINLSSSNVFRYTAVVVYIKKYKYTDKECKEILTAIGWTSFIRGIADTNRRLSVKSFIKRYKNVYGAQSNTKNNVPGADREYCYSLPADVADMYDLHLVNYGMTIHENGRRGIREAMIKLINNKLG